MHALAVRLGVLVVVTGMALTGCSQESSTDRATPQEPVVVDVAIANGKVTPSGDRVEVGVGQPVTFEVTADAPGELHVHSEPEHSVEFQAGSTSETITIDQPGVVEVELHEPPVVVVQLQVQ